jgi:hypothetical protein
MLSRWSSPGTDLGAHRRHSMGGPGHTDSSSDRSPVGLRIPPGGIETYDFLSWRRSFDSAACGGWLCSPSLPSRPRVARLHHRAHTERALQRRRRVAPPHNHSTSLRGPMGRSQGCTLSGPPIPSWLTNSARCPSDCGSRTKGHRPTTARPFGQRRSRQRAEANVSGLRTHINAPALATRSLQDPGRGSGSTCRATATHRKTSSCSRMARMWAGWCGRLLAVLLSRNLAWDHR